MIIVTNDILKWDSQISYLLINDIDVSSEVELLVGFWYPCHIYDIRIYLDTNIRLDKRNMKDSQILTTEYATENQYPINC